MRQPVKADSASFSQVPATTADVLRPLLLISAMLLAASCSQDPATESAASSTASPPQVMDAAASCKVLAGAPIAATDIGLPTSGATVSSAMLVAADLEGNANGEYCKVMVAIHPVDTTAPDINAEVNLPTNWNHKALHFGGGGLNGTVVTGLGPYVKQPETDPTALARGYVTYGSDSGHQSSGGFDGTFYLNQEALENFGHQQLKKTHDAAMWLIQQRYAEPVQYSYFAGGSQGGHEGFDVLQRFPDDYAGVLAGYPAHNVLMLHLSALNFTRALYANEGRSWLSTDKVNTLVSQVYALCDPLDGASDGIISNVAACTAASAVFTTYTDSNPLRCVDGADTGNACLSDAQLQALNAINTPYAVGFRLNSDDVDSAVFPRWTPFEGSTYMDGGFPNLGAGGPDQALQRAPAVATNGLAIARDPTLDVIRDFDPLQWVDRITELAPVMSANSVDLDAFRARGGKLIYFHGTVDDFISPYSSIQYYNRLLQHYGQAGTDEFVRFYTIPGMGHVTGVFNARLSGLDALEAWVEHGTAPGNLVAVDANADQNGRTRPVCVYPGWPQYTGAGDINQASSFTCVRDSAAR